MMPAATALMRPSRTSPDWLSRPSPEMSMTCRLALTPRCSRVAYSSAALIAVAPSRTKRWVRSISEATRSADWASRTTSQPKAWLCSSTLDHCIRLTATPLGAAAWMAFTTPGLRKASASPRICRWNSRPLTLPEESTASTSARSTGCSARAVGDIASHRRPRNKKMKRRVMPANPVISRLGLCPNHSLLAQKLILVDPDRQAKPREKVASLPHKSLHSATSHIPTEP